MLRLILVLLSAAIAAIMAARLCTRRWGGNTVKVAALSTVLALSTTFLAFFLRGFGESIRTIFISNLCFYVSYGDVITHEADDWIHFLLLVTALIAKPLTQIPVSLVAALITGGVMVLVTLFVPKSGIGGADIKFTAAAAFLTTFEGGLCGLGLGAFAALLFNSPFRKKKAGEETGFPMLPYLSCSYILVYLLS